MLRLRLVLAALLVCLAAAGQTANTRTNWEKWSCAGLGPYNLYFIHNFNSDAARLGAYTTYTPQQISSMHRADSMFRQVFAAYPKAYDSFLRADIVYYNDDNGKYRKDVISSSFKSDDRVALAPLMDVLATNNDMMNRSDGFFANLYYDRGGDSYILAFRGTDSSWSDIVTDYNSNFLGKANSQLDKAAKVAVALSRLPAPLRKRIRLTGHSLGGGLASLTAVLSGLRCDTFNAMGIPEDVIDHYSGVFASATGRNKADVKRSAQSNKSRIRAFMTDTDILSKAQNLAQWMNSATDLLSSAADLANSLFGAGTVNTDKLVKLVTAEALGHRVVINTGITEAAARLYKGHRLKSFLPKP